MECPRNLRISKIIKLLGLIQCVLAIILTSLGIAVVVKFREVHHEANSPYEQAIDYIDNPWTTTYAAGVWIGLVLLLAGIFGSSADIKPEKSKYAYASLTFNIMVVIFAIILIPFTIHGLNWYQTCQYTYHMSNGNIGTRDCSEQDKDVGTGLYVVSLLALVLVLPVTIAFIVFLIIGNMVLFEGCFNGGWYRQCVYGMKGKNNATVNLKTKNTHEFDRVYDDANSTKLASPIKGTEQMQNKPVYAEINRDSSKRKNTYKSYERNNDQRQYNEDNSIGVRNDAYKYDEDHQRGRTKDKTANQRHRSLSAKEKRRKDVDRHYDKPRPYDRKEKRRSNNYRHRNDSNSERSESDSDRERSSQKRRRSRNTVNKGRERNHKNVESDDHSTDNYSSSIYL